MKRTVLMLSLFIAIAAQSQDLLDNSWQIALGDSSIWKDPSYNSSHWKNIKSGAVWEEQGFKNYDGFAWYRKKVYIPVELKTEALEKGGLELSLGTVNDVDQTYFNGKMVSTTGKFPPAYDTAYDKERSCTIEVGDILWGKENVIAVRVYDGAGGGGITGQDVVLKVRGAPSFFKIEPKFPNPNQIIDNGAKTSFALSFNNSSNIDIKGTVGLLLVNDFKDTISFWSTSMNIPALTNKLFPINKLKLPPGFYSLLIDFKSKLSNVSKSFNFGVEPEKIVSQTTIPADFDDFWMRAKRELASVDPQYKLTLIDSLSSTKRNVYSLEMRSLYNVLIRGYYIRPKAEGKFPAILHLQGYSTDPKIGWGYPGDDMAVLILNVRGHGNSRDDINPGFPGFLMYNLKDKERYIYRGAYMDCVRAVDFLCSREEVDSRYLVVEGASQGGAMSIATAALANDRVKLCIPAVPFLSDFQDYFKIAGWPANEFRDFESKNQTFGWKGIFETLSYYDIKNLAHWVKCPVFMTVGLKDKICPPHINFAAYNQLSVPKSYNIYTESGHSLPGEYFNTKFDWMKKELEKLKLKK
ncbi:MAG: acetylxylan esterase [Bacteroidales bacterium]|nr:acetylxylan esterase [Bacteroidales bacterium]